MSAVIEQSGRMRPLDRPAEPDQQLTPEQWSDVPRMVRLVMNISRDIKLLGSRFNPQRLDYEDRLVDGTGTTVYRFPHGFNGRVRWWPTDWTGAAGFQLSRHSSSDNNTLALVSYVAGTVTLRIEAAG